MLKTNYYLDTTTEKWISTQQLESSINLYKIGVIK